MFMPSLKLFVGGIAFAILTGPFACGEEPSQPNFVAAVDKQREIYSSSTSSLESQLTAINRVCHICRTSKDSKVQMLGLEFLSFVSIAPDSEFLLRAAALSCLNRVVETAKDDSLALTALSKVQIVLDAEISELPLQLYAINQIYKAGSGDGKSSELVAFARQSFMTTIASESKSAILVAVAADKLATLDKLKTRSTAGTQKTATTPSTAPDLSKQPLAASDFGQCAGNVSNSASDGMGVSITRDYDAAKDSLSGKRSFTKPKTEPKKGNNTGASRASGATGLTFKPSNKQ